MKNQIKLILLSLAFIVIASAMSSCSARKHHKKEKVVKVHCYKAPNTSTDATDDFLWWYVIYMDNGTYFTSSSTPITSFTSYSGWTSSSSNIADSFKGATEVESINQNVSELPTEIAENISETEISTIEVEVTGEEATYGESENTETDSGTDGVLEPTSPAIPFP